MLATAALYKKQNHNAASKKVFLYSVKSVLGTLEYYKGKIVDSVPLTKMQSLRVEKVPSLTVNVS